MVLKIDALEAKNDKDQDDDILKVELTMKKAGMKWDHYLQ